MIVCEERLRAACLEYLQLRGLLWGLPLTHPARRALGAAVARAELVWHSLATGAAFLEAERSDTEPCIKDR